MITYIRLLTVILFGAASAYAMDSKPKKDPARKYTINCTILSQITTLSQIAFLNNDSVVIHRTKEYPETQIINITGKKRDINLRALSGLPQERQASYVPGRKERIITDYDKKKVMLSWYENNYVHITVYDSQTEKTYIKEIPCLQRDDQKEWTNCFSAPDTVLLYAGNPASIVSYNYHNQTMSCHKDLTHLFKRNEADGDTYYNFNYLCNPLVGQKVFHCARFTGYRMVDLMNIQSCTVSDETWYWQPNSNGSLLAYCVLPKLGGCKENQSCDCNDCYVLDVQTKKVTQIDTHNKHVFYTAQNGNRRSYYLPHCSIAFHPNNKVIALLPGSGKPLQYWHAETGILIAQQQLLADEAHCTDDDLSFSADGSLLAVIFPTKCVIFKVPFEDIASQCYGVGTQEKLASLLLLLQHYVHDGALLPDDIVRSLVYKTMQLLKL